MEMSEIHFNEAEDLRITRVEQFVPGKQFDGAESRSSLLRLCTMRYCLPGTKLFPPL